MTDASGGALPPRLGRLAEELSEVGFVVPEPASLGRLMLEEIDYALRPRVHERRVPSFGSIVEPAVPPEQWEDPTRLHLTRRAVGTFPVVEARLFADGLSSWLVRSIDGEDASIVFDRSAGSERDLVVLAEVAGATLVQRHPSGVVRVVGSGGVLRHDGIAWSRERPVRTWIDSIARGAGDDQEILRQLLVFAVHDLGARGIGATLVLHCGDPSELRAMELRSWVPPPLQIDQPADLAPLTHVLAQVDGATIFDGAGTLRHLGVRLVPTPQAEAEVDGLGGMRHTSAKRYSFDEPSATVVVVSEDGPVSVLRAGEVIGRAESSVASAED